MGLSGPESRNEEGSSKENRWEPEVQLQRKETPGHTIWPRLEMTETSLKGTETSGWQTLVCSGEYWGFGVEEPEAGRELGHAMVLGVGERSSKEEASAAMGKQRLSEDHRTRSS